MSMPATAFNDEFVPDPDELKMPESPDHREAVELIAVFAERLLSPQFEVFRDMNWYPTDAGNAVAPDVMVLPAGAMEPEVGQPRPKSYRQDQIGGPLPLAVIEVASETDSYPSLWAKARRYRELGVPTYLVSLEAGCNVFLTSPQQRFPVPWVDEPIPELGGLRLSFDDDNGLVVIGPDGVRHDSVVGALAEAERRAEALAAQLRSLGHDPDSPTPTG